MDHHSVDQLSHEDINNARRWPMDQWAMGQGVNASSQELIPVPAAKLVPSLAQPPEQTIVISHLEQHKSTLDSQSQGNR